MAEEHEALLVEALEEDRVEVAKSHRLAHDLRDQLHEAGLSDCILAHDVVGLAIGLGVAEHGRHGDGQILDVAELTEPAAVARNEHGSITPDAVHEERLVVPGVQRAHDVSRPHDADGPAPRPVALEEQILRGYLVSRVVAPVESARRIFGVGDGQGVVVDAPRGDEDDVGLAREGGHEGGHVLAKGRRVGDVEDAVEAVALEALAQARVVLAIAGDGRDAGGQAFRVPPAVEGGDVVTTPEELLNEVEADELRAADHEDPHDARILA